MIKNVVYVSQAQAERWMPRETDNFAIISITGTHDPEANLDKNFKKVLKCKFDDIDEAILDDPKKNRKYYGINEIQAQEIIALTEELVKDEKFWLVIVHCHAGISRSAAVAKFISGKAGLYFLTSYNLYNKFVYSLLEKLDYYNSQNL